MSVPVARDSDRVLLDTSPFINFSDGGALHSLASYLGARAAVALDVDNELRRNAANRFPDLRALEELGWPEGDPLALPPDLLADAEALRRLNSPIGAHEDANRGEIATALLAGRLRALVVMDDELGKNLCRRRGLKRLSSAQLAAEMVAAGAIEAEIGLEVFEVATPPGVGHAEFEEALGRAAAATS